MPARIKPQAESLYGTPQPLFSNIPSAPVISKRDPISSDTGFPLGQEWINKVLNNTWFLTSVVAGVANWEAIPGGSIILGVPNGGTGRSSLTAHGVLIGEGTSPIDVTAAGSDGQVLTGNTGADPTFDAIGTKSGLTAHGVVLAEGASAFVATAVGTDGQVLTGNSAANPTFDAIGTKSGLTGIVLGNGASAFTTTSFHAAAAFTPAFALSTPGDSAWTYTGASTVGRYTQLGSMVFFVARLVWTNFTNSTGSGTWQVNLPVTSGAFAYAGSFQIAGSGVDAAAQTANLPANFCGNVASSVSTAVLSVELGGVGNATNSLFSLTVNQVLTTGDMQITGWYFAS